MDRCIGKIVADVTARTGTAPDFVFGKGVGVLADGRAIDLHNTMGCAFPAGPAPVLFAELDGHWFIEAADCPA